MFAANTYIERRAELARRIGKGLILIAGNMPSPNNYPNNAYYFRQDSTFLYYFGLNLPSLVGVIDAETGEASLYGDDFTVEDIIWTGPQPSLVELGAHVGVAECNCRPVAALRKTTDCSVAKSEHESHDSIIASETDWTLESFAKIILRARGSSLRSPNVFSRNCSIKRSFSNSLSPMRTIIIYCTSKISKRFLPLGVMTSAISPFFLPRSAFPIGLVKLIFPLIASTPSGETII